jgi:hypothetical protein
MRRLGGLPLVAVLGLGWAAPAAAQTSSSGGAQGGAPDFLFGWPRLSASIRGSLHRARASSDLYDFVQTHLTLDRRDFDAPVIGGDVGVALTPRLDLLVGVDFARTTTASEYREYVGSDRLPIAQETRLTGLDISGTLRLALVPRGQRISRLAWVPARVSPYAGAGVGLLRYSLEQRGEFVDFVDLSIFPSRFVSSGWAPSVHVCGGAEVRILRRLLATSEVRYLWAESELGQDFAGFEPLDLAGLRVAGGIRVVF